MQTEGIITVICCWVLATIIIPGLMGILVAHYEDCTYEKDFGHPDLHALYTLTRCFILAPIAYNVFLVCSMELSMFASVWMGIIFFLLTVLFTWSLFYNGLQYSFRQYLSEGRVYKKGFFDKKEDGYGDKINSAELNLSFPARFGFYLVGSAGILVIILEILN